MMSVQRIESCRIGSHRSDSRYNDESDFVRESLSIANGGPQMKKLVGTSNDVALTMLRLVLGVVFFAHGAQKTLGWFGGYGFHGTMGFFTHMGMPAPVALLVICTEFFGGLGLIVGLLTRIAALGIGVEMIGAIFMVHLPNGFFMNWAGNQKGEGFEYHLLAIAIAATLLLRGAGAFSVDRALSDKP
jgi:putative oxidoreductase